MPNIQSVLIWFGVILVISLSVKIFKKRSSGFSILVYKGLSTLLLITLTFPNVGGSRQTSESGIHFADEIDALLILEDDALLFEVQKATFRYFWDFAHPASGMIRERNTSGNLVTTGGSGFGIMAILVGIQNGFITRDQGLTRMEQVVDFLDKADRFHGAWPHWLNGNTGKVIPFSPKDDGGDLVETAFMVQGLLTARNFFAESNDNEKALREKITQLWETVDWNWYRKSVQKELYWHWSPNFGWEKNLPIRGWNETMITYILAIASPTHPVPPTLYHQGWASNQYENGRTFYGYKLEVGRETGGPLFFTHYSFLGLDPRGKRDAYANYFFQGVNQTLINRAWCMENPKQFAGYGENCWGLTASDDPSGYKAHAPQIDRDNGTITPSAAISSIVYTPRESIAAIRHFLSSYREKVWGTMGFYDAFNVQQNWYTNAYLAIDQGPIICMIENYRTQLLWQLFMENEEIQGALEVIGFTEDASTVATYKLDDKASFRLYPNPSEGNLFLEWANPTVSMGSWELSDQTGRVLLQGTIERQTNKLKIKMNENIPSGLYHVKIDINDNATTRKIILTH